MGLSFIKKWWFWVVLAGLLLNFAAAVLLTSTALLSDEKIKAVVEVRWSFNQTMSEQLYAERKAARISLPLLILGNMMLIGAHFIRDK